MGSKNPLSPQFPDPCAEYLYTLPPGVPLKKLSETWVSVDEKAYCFVSLRKRSQLEKWVVRRKEHWEEVRKREEEMQVGIDARAAASYRKMNCETAATVQGGLKSAAEMAAGRLNLRLAAAVSDPSADRGDVEILLKTAIGSKTVAEVWAGFHGVVPIEAEAGDITIEYIVPPWAIEDEEMLPEPLPPDAKMIDLVSPSNGDGSNGSNGTNGNGSR